MSFFQELPNGRGDKYIKQKYCSTSDIQDIVELVKGYRPECHAVLRRLNKALKAGIIQQRNIINKKITYCLTEEETEYIVNLF